MLCPICSQAFQGDQPAFEFHVNHCLDETPSRSSSSKLADSNDTCPSCFATWRDLSLPEHERESHILACLMVNESQETPFAKSKTEPGNSCPICRKVFKESENLFLHVERCLIQAREGENQQWADSGLDEGEMDIGFDLYTTENGTKGKAPVQGVAGLFPIISALLEKSNSSSTHHGASAVLCSASTLHTSVKFGEYGWGFSCGYLSFQMLFSAMRHLSNYQPLFSDPSAGQTLAGPPLPPIPTICQFQEIIEKAWAQGYDPDGAEHFNKKLVGSRKWIGTTEIFAVFTFLGVKVKMFDFPRATGPKETHTALIRWVKNYFEADALEPEEGETSGKKRQRDAFEKIMVTGGQSVKQTEKQPLFLQHQGHSKVIVGIELASKGRDASLLVFDPSRPDKSKVRKAAVDYAAQDNPDRPAFKRQRSNQAASGSSTSSSSIKRDSDRLSVTAWMRSLTHLAKSDDLDLKDHADMLKPYRWSLKELSKNDQYQILYVDPNASPLTAKEKQRKHIPHSIRIV